MPSWHAHWLLFVSSVNWNSLLIIIKSLLCSRSMRSIHILYSSLQTNWPFNWKPPYTVVFDTTIVLYFYSIHPAQFRYFCPFASTGIPTGCPYMKISITPAKPLLSSFFRVMLIFWEGFLGYWFPAFPSFVIGNSNAPAAPAAISYFSNTTTMFPFSSR